MKASIEKFLEYLRSVRNASPHTILSYGKDLEQFQTFMTPPGTTMPALNKINHQVIREYIGHLHEDGLEKSSIARKLAALRSFFKYCVREGRLKENPARLVPTPKLPKRIPAVLSAEEMSGFLDQLAGMQSPRRGRREERPGRCAIGAHDGTAQDGGQPSSAPGPRHSRTALCRRAPRERTDRIKPCRHGSEKIAWCVLSAREEKNGLCLMA